MEINSYLCQPTDCIPLFRKSVKEIIDINPLSPNVADLQHFDTVLFCGFSLQHFSLKYRNFHRKFVSSSPLSTSSKKGGLTEKAAIKTETVRK